MWKLAVPENSWKRGSCSDFVYQREAIENKCTSVLEAGIRKGDTMHEFQDGEEARVIKHGVEVEVMVFRQTGDLVYVFDKENRAYQYPARDVMPARTLYTDTHEQGGVQRRESTAPHHVNQLIPSNVAWKYYLPPNWEVVDMF